MQERKQCDIFEEKKRKQEKKNRRRISARHRSTSVTTKLRAPCGTDIINCDPAPLVNISHLN